MVDGDTVLVSDGTQKKFLHLLGIDAPEKGQALAKEAKDFVLNTLSNSYYTVKPINLPGRKLPSCVIRYRDAASGNFRDLSCELLYKGLAYLDPKSIRRIRKPQKFMLSEKHSRKNNRGVWALEKRIFPWDYRNVFYLQEIELASQAQKTTQALRHLEEGQLDLERGSQKQEDTEKSRIVDFYQDLLFGPSENESRY